MKDETAWLVERAGPEWLQTEAVDGDGGKWTKDANQAMRYRTEALAEDAIISRKRPFKVLVVGTATQHSWFDAVNEPKP